MRPYPIGSLVARSAGGLISIGAVLLAASGARATITETVFIAEGAATAASGAASDGFSASGSPVFGSAAVDGSDGPSSAIALAESGLSGGQIDFESGAFSSGKNSSSVATSGFTRTFTYDGTSNFQSLYLESLVYAGSVGFFVADFSAAGCSREDILGCSPVAGTPLFGSGNGEAGMTVEIATRDASDPAAEFATVLSFGVRLNLDGSYTYEDNSLAQNLLRDFATVPSASGVNGLSWSSSPNEFFIGGMPPGFSRDVRFTTSAFSFSGTDAPHGLVAYSCVGDPIGGGLAGGGGGNIRSGISIASFASLASPLGSAALGAPLCQVGITVAPPLQQDVPAPGALWLLSLGAAALLAAQRRRVFSKGG